LRNELRRRGDGETRGRGELRGGDGETGRVMECKEWQDALVESERHQLELKQSEERLRTLNQDILRLVMIMSHDIRGPLVALAATLKLLLRGSYGNMDESVKNTLKDLQARVIRLLGVAEDYLGKTHSLEGSLKIEREMLDLRQDIIDPILDELANEIQERNILIDNRLGAIPAGTIPLKANKIWLKTVFRNLFTNAIKYGGKGCKIAFGFEDHGAYYRLNVYNSGPPVPPVQRDKLFTKFFRGEVSGRDDHNGVGLGLFLIQEIIHRHGGKIWYDARQDGSDFVFTIAKEPAQEDDDTGLTQ
jgi:signal transduction histidine kinase